MGAQLIKFFDRRQSGAHYSPTTNSDARGGGIGERVSDLVRNVWPTMRNRFHSPDRKLADHAFSTFRLDKDELVLPARSYWVMGIIEKFVVETAHYPRASDIGAVSKEFGPGEIHVPTLKPILDELVRRGYVERVEDGGRPRPGPKAEAFSLTPQGRLWLSVGIQQAIDCKEVA
ncbi:MAG: hypothetical protein FD152_1539 [Xanthobacteraceae bacterium]|nr:MAG: hypothetical protein FD152_1539 [Xanthobacteraceae bacterium]